MDDGVTRLPFGEGSIQIRLLEEKEVTVVAHQRWQSAMVVLAERGGGGLTSTVVVTPHDQG
jgi:hypothetical protein